MFGMVDGLGIVSVNMDSAAEFEEHNLFCFSAIFTGKMIKPVFFLFTCVLL